MTRIHSTNASKAACAVVNMYFTATACGIGCYLSTGGITNFAEAKSFFGLTPEDKLLGFLHICMPQAPARVSKRKPI